MGRQKIHVSFEQKIKLRDWMIANRGRIKDEKFTKESLARLLSGVLEMELTSNHIDSVSGTIDPPIEWSMTRDGITNMELFQRVQDLTGKVERIAADATDAGRSIVPRLVKLEADVRELLLATKELSRKMDRVWEELGYKKLDDGVRDAATKIMQERKGS